MEKASHRKAEWHKWQSHILHQVSHMYQLVLLSDTTFYLNLMKHKIYLLIHYIDGSLLIIPPLEFHKPQISGLIWLGRNQHKRKSEYLKFLQETLLSLGKYIRLFSL